MSNGLFFASQLVRLYALRVRYIVDREQESLDFSNSSRYLIFGSSLVTLIRCRYLRIDSFFGRPVRGLDAPLLRRELRKRVDRVVLIGVPVSRLICGGVLLVLSCPRIIFL